MINKSQEVLIINDTTTQFNFEISLLEPFASMCENARFSATGISLKLSRKRSGVPYSSFFIPTGTFTVVSMVSFLIQPDAVPGRMGLIVTLLLISSNVYAQVDHHGFSNLDVWAIGSQIPIIFALFQYGLVLLMMKYCNVKKSFRKFDCVSACIVATYYFGFNCYFWGLASRHEWISYHSNSKPKGIFEKSVGRKIIRVLEKRIVELAKCCFWRTLCQALYLSTYYAGSCIFLTIVNYVRQIKRSHSIHMFSLQIDTKSPWFLSSTTLNCPSL